MSRWSLLVLPLVVLGLLGCSSEPEPGPAATAATTVEAASGGGRPDGIRCVEPQEALVRLIAASLTVTGATLRNPQAVVASRQDDPVVFVSARVDGEGVVGDGAIGTWALSVEEDGYGRVHPVGGAATAFSDWRAEPSRLSMDDEGARESAACVQSG